MGWWRESAFSAHIVSVIIQSVLEHVDRSRLDNMTWQFIPLRPINNSLAEEILPDLSGWLWIVEFQTAVSLMTGYWACEELTLNILSIFSLSVIILKTSIRSPRSLRSKFVAGANTIRGPIYNPRALNRSSYGTAFSPRTIFVAMVSSLALRRESDWEPLAHIFAILTLL